MANAGRLLRLKASIEKELNELVELKSEKDGLDFERAHPRTLASVLHDLYTGFVCTAANSCGSDYQK